MIGLVTKQKTKNAKNLSSFTLISFLNLYDFHSSVDHKRRYFGDIFLSI